MPRGGTQRKRRGWDGARPAGADLVRNKISTRPASGSARESSWRSASIMRRCSTLRRPAQGRAPVLSRDRLRADAREGRQAPTRGGVAQAHPDVMDWQLSFSRTTGADQYQKSLSCAGAMRPSSRPSKTAVEDMMRASKTMTRESGALTRFRTAA